MGMTLNWNVRERLSVLRPRLFDAELDAAMWGFGLDRWLSAEASLAVANQRVRGRVNARGPAVHSGATFKWPIEICIAGDHHCLRGHAIYG